MTVTGKTLAENLEHAKPMPHGQDVIRPLSKPIKATGHIRFVDASSSFPLLFPFFPRFLVYVLLPSCSALFPIYHLTLLNSSSILRGNLAPGGCVSKITGKEGLEFEGKARVFDNEDDVAKAIEQKSIKVGEKTVIVLRYLGPKGGPGSFLSSFFLLLSATHFTLFSFPLLAHFIISLSTLSHHSATERDQEEELMQICLFITTGMPEMLKTTSMVIGAGLGMDVACVTDGRFSGGTHGFTVGHVVPVSFFSSSSLSHFPFLLHRKIEKGLLPTFLLGLL